MATTTFTDGSTIIVASWLNEVDALVYDIFNGLSTTTKGDVLASNGTNIIPLAVGSNDHVLTADSSEPTGVKWAAGGGDVVDDTTPQLGGFLDTNGKFISMSQGTAIASVAGDTNIWTNADGNTVHITGTNAITDFGTPKRIGDHMWLIFDAAASVVDSSTITVAGNTNYQAAANDLAGGSETVDEGSGGKVVDSVTFPKGIVIYGRFTEIDVDSGSVVAYIGD